MTDEPTGTPGPDKVNDRIRIAAAQSPVGHDPAANGAAVRELMRAAAGQGARLIHFPEGALTGHSPGAAPFAFDVDGFRFGCVLCIEVNFPELFLEYRVDGVDCVLFSSYSEDPVFEIIARGHAAAHSSWISVSVPAQCAAAMPAGVIGPHGTRLADCPAAPVPALVCVDLDRTDPALDFALHRARPWRTISREGRLYRERRVDDDPRSIGRMSF